MFATVTELKENLEKYLDLVDTEDIYITRNGKTIAKLCSPYRDKLKIVNELAGSIPATITLEEARDERLSKI
ncbi:MAG: type II toxin-antitoxin system Phd/YefM family antitoxin [Oscillospiraceae bacterium]|nr:type II toxin-antitoxin system Phd/YefM family antitoxin [Oscillospiraceae bacterium]